MLQQLACRCWDGALPAEVSELLVRAQAMLDAYSRTGRDVVVPAFVPTRFDLVYRLLRSIDQKHLVVGARFCEWGSGLGIVSMLAAGLGLDALGIEIDSHLVDLSNQLAESAGSRARFHCGSFIPRGGSDWADQLIDDLSWMRTTSDDTYEQLGLAVADFDLIYVYPWPGEVRYVRELFDQTAGPGALLLVYHGADEWRLWKKKGVRPL